MQYMESGRVDAQQFKRKISKMREQTTQSRPNMDQQIDSSSSILREEDLQDETEDDVHENLAEESNQQAPLQTFNADEFNDDIALPSHEYTNLGPMKLSNFLHRSRCSLLLYVGEGKELAYGPPMLDSEHRVLRSDIDFYPYDTNFSDLPNLDRCAGSCSPGSSLADDQ